MIRSALPFGPGMLAAAVLALGATACGQGQPTASPFPPREGSAPAHRIISLAPSLTELVFAAGAGDRLVGVVEFSNHPDEARLLPRVGDAFRFDYEAIAGLHPDLILGWPSGNSAEALNHLRRLGYRVVGLEPKALADIGGQIIVIGELAGTGDGARRAAEQFAGEIASLRSRYLGAAPIRVFFQVAPQPLITVTSRHFIGQAIEICGGVNVFGDIDATTPTVGREAVLAANPAAIVGSDYTEGSANQPRGGPLDAWRQWPRLSAVAASNLFVIDPDLLSVPSPRILKGIESLCEDLAIARDRVRRSTPR